MRLKNKIKRRNEEAYIHKNREGYFLKMGNHKVMNLKRIFSETMGERAEATASLFNDEMVERKASMLEKKIRVYEHRMHFVIYTCRTVR